MPAVHMKLKREHRVALSDAAIALLTSLPAANHRTGLVFPAPRGEQYSDMTFGKLMREMRKADGTQWLDRVSKDPCVPHGLRSTFRDWAAGHTYYPSDMVELALAHAVGNKVEAAYRRGNQLERRRELAQDYANFLQGAA